MTTIKLTEMKLLKGWDGTLVLQLNANCTNEKLLVLESDHWTQGALLETWDFTEGELEEVEDGDILLKRGDK